MLGCGLPTHIKAIFDFWFDLIYLQYIITSRSSVIIGHILGCAIHSDLDLREAAGGGEVGVYTMALFVAAAGDRVYLYVISRRPEQSVIKFLYDGNATPKKLKYIERITETNVSDFVR